MNSDIGIAIVGMAGRFPGAGNVDEFWQNLAHGVESITRLSDEEILKSGVSPSYLSDRNYVKAAAVLEQPEYFDAMFFGFSPMEAKTMDPQHRVLLELAYEALENAGYDSDRYQGRVGVFTGAAMNTYFMNRGLNTRFAEEYISTLIVNDKDFLSTRISYKLNLKGPSITIQTACSTSLVAIHLACQSLLSEETDMALAGAVSVRVPHRAGYFCDGGGVVSPDGHVRTFDATANGTVFGSGGGIVVLKRLADALASGDTIHAVIKGSAVNNDGSEKAGYTAPSVNSQADAVVEALANAGVTADSISYVEAHGSGTPVGDPIEIMALTKAFRAFTQRSGYCAVGSVKTNVGHLDAAAGVAGIIKTVLALEHRQLPPSLHFSKANPEIDFPSTPFYVNTQLLDWTSHGPRRAGVMSTGMGGTNAHVVLEEAPQPAATTNAGPPRLLVLSAKTETALDQITLRLRDFLSRNVTVNMDDVAFTLQVGRKAFPHRRCVVCADQTDAITALDDEHSPRILSGRVDESARRPVIFLLPGIGDHYVGMAHDLYETWDVFRQEVDRCSLILEAHLGIDIRTVIYPNSQSWRRDGKSKGIDLKKMLGRQTDAAEDPDAAILNQTRFAQPALFTIEYALSRLWQSFGITPDAIVGHSMGEYVAACLAGVLSLEDALQLIAARAKLVNALPQGAMLAVTLSERDLRPLLTDHLSIALINGPRLCVVAGPVAAVAAFEMTLNERDVISRHIQNAHAFHSTMLDPIVQALEAEVKKLQLNPPAIPYISNVTGTWITAAEATDPAYWARHANHTSRFSDALHELWQHRDAILLEVGPGRTLGVLAMQHPERTQAGDPVAVSSVRHHYENESDAAFLLRGVCKLWLAGVGIKWEGYHAGQRRRRISLPTYPFERQAYWLEMESDSSKTPQAQHQDAAQSSIDDWLYVPTWERTLFPNDTTAQSHPDAASWLIIGDRYGGGACIKGELEKRGLTPAFVRFGEQFGQHRDGSFELNPASADDYLKLFKNLQSRSARAINIVHLGALTRDEATTPSAWPSNQNFGFYSLLHIAQAIGELNVAIPIKIGIVSNRIHEVTGDEVLNPEMATVLGPCGVIPKEFPNVTCVNIDLPDTRSIDDLPADMLTKVLAEFSGTPESQAVAYRGHYRWRPRYHRVTLPTVVPTDASNDTPELGRLRRGGVYLITGGTGGIGLAIAKYLATTCQPKIVLTKKTAFPAKSMWTVLSTDKETSAPIRRTIKALLELEALGAEVEVLVADSADEREMQNVRDQILARFRTINGVIHSAGIVRPGLIQAKTKETADSVLAPKVYGTLILFDLFKNVDLDFFVLLSSITSIITPYAQADYSGANAFLDAFAYFANRKSGFRTLTINWPGWKEVGIIADLQTLPGVEGWKEAALKKAIATRDGVEVFRRALNSNLKHVIVSPEDFNQLWEQSQLPVDPEEYLSSLVRLDELPGRPSGKDDRPALPALITAEVGPSRVGSQHRPSTEEELAEVWCHLLNLPRVSLDDDFFKLGGHSLLGIRLMSEIEKRFNVKLPLASLFRNRTIREQARVLTDRPMAETWLPIVPIQPRGTRPPFFLVHGIGGEVLSFEALSRHLGSDQPIYGVQADTGKGPGFFSSVEEVATTYLRHVRQHTPSGPYRLGGYSSGGIIAYEMAQQLRAAGQQVAILVMFDSDASPLGSKAKLSPIGVWRLLKNAAYWFVDDEFCSLSRQDQRTRLVSRGRAMYARARQGMGTGNGQSKADIRDQLGLWNMPEASRVPLEAHFNMLCAYRPRPYPGSVTVLRARTDRLMSMACPDLGWQPLALGGVSVLQIPGAHDTILKEPRVRVLAAALDATLLGTHQPG